MHKLYRLFGKPWNAATEGSEHLHQDMKRYFLHLTCHSNKKTGDCLQVLRLMLVKQSLLRKYAHLLPHSQYAAMRANMVLSKDAADKGKKRCNDSGPKGYKMYSEKRQRKMMIAKDTIEAELCCAPCVLSPDT